MKLIRETLILDFLKKSLINKDKIKETKPRALLNWKSNIFLLRKMKNDNLFRLKIFFQVDVMKLFQI